MMRLAFWRKTALLAFLSLAVFLASPCPGHAKDTAAAHGPLTLAVGEGQLVRLPRPAASVFVADPDVADIQTPSRGALFVLGKKAGATTLYAIDGDDETVLKVDITVSHNIEELTRILRQRFPDLHLTLASAPGSLMVSGEVDSPEEVNGVANTLAPFLSTTEKLINSVQVRAPTQIQLRVRFSEISRNVIQDLGISWGSVGQSGNWKGGLFNGRSFYDSTAKTYTKSATDWGMLMGFTAGASDIEAMIDALDGEGLITTLAEPNLTTVSGQTASFLAGGEFPIPIAQQNNTLSIEFKAYGVSLAFTPTVLANNHISLRVRPEVSALDWSDAVTLSNAAIPAITVRRADTTVELSSGQSFAIGGLLQNNMTESVSRLPGLGNLPVLGRLFSSQDYQNKRSELVIIVTAYLVRPTDPTALRTPDQSQRPPNDVEYIAQTQLGKDPLSAGALRLVGTPGFAF